MSNTQQFSAFSRSRLVMHPNHADALASEQHLYAYAEACPAQPYMNPMGYQDIHVVDPTCGEGLGSVGSVYFAQETLEGGPQNPSGLVKYGLLRDNVSHAGSRVNYLNNW